MIKKEGTNTWNSICHYFGRINVKMPTIPTRVLYKFSKIPSKSLMIDSTNTEKNSE